MRLFCVQKEEHEREHSNITTGQVSHCMTDLIEEE